MGFGEIVAQMLVVSLPIALGWCIGRLGLLSRSFERELSALLLDVAMPCLIVSSVFGGADLPDMPSTLILMGSNVVAYAVAIALAFGLTWFMRAPRGERASYRFAVIFGNAGFIGFPVIMAMLGERALVYAAVALVSINFFMFTIGRMLFTGLDGGCGKIARDLIDCCKSPTMVASYVVLACLMTGWTDWGFVGESISLVGQMTTPSALLLMGASIAHHRISEMVGNPRAYIAAFGRLLLVPLAVMAVLGILHVPPFIISVVVIGCAMPVATNGTLYAIQYDTDARSMMQGTFLSIVASVVTIPFVAMMLPV